MNGFRDTAAAVTGLLTAGYGGWLTLDQVESLVGILAGLAGLILTVSVYVWRRHEHKLIVRKHRRRE